jgi:SAM-dependent methyltransferase
MVGYLDDLCESWIYRGCDVQRLDRLNAEGGLSRPVADESPRTIREELRQLCFEQGGYPERWPRHEVCPVCRSASLHPHFSKYGFSHSQCASCFFVCVDPYPPETIVRKLYEGHYYSSVREHGELPRMRKGERGTEFTFGQEDLDEVIRVCTKQRGFVRWLDVGGGLGDFAMSVLRMHPEWDVCINEWNTKSREIAMSEFGVQVVDASPEKLAAAGQKFDVISMMAVLEHCTHPAKMVAEYIGLLNEGGRLAIVLPHFSRLNGAVSRGSSPNVCPPFHVSLFNETNLRLLLGLTEGVGSIDTWQFGAPAFLLHEHIPYGDHWDVTIPTADDPQAKGVQIQQYTEEEGQLIALLAEANGKMSEYFARTDGRSSIVAVVHRG